MSMQDPIADMITRISNAQVRFHPEVVIPASGIKDAIAKVLLDEGYIAEYVVEKDKKNDKKKHLKIKLKYFNNKPVIEMIRRGSRPGLKEYTSARNMPIVMDGLGIVIVSTPKGVMTGRSAVALGQGGEVLCYVS